MTLFEYVQQQRAYYYSYCDAVKFEPLTTIFSDFTLNELDNEDATGKIKELYDSVKEQYTNAGAHFAADLGFCLNLKSWYFAEAIKGKWQTVKYIGGEEVAGKFQNLYIDLFYNYKDYAVKHLKDSDEVYNFLDLID